MSSVFQSLSSMANAELSQLFCIPRLKPGDFVGTTFYCLNAFAYGKLYIWIREKMLSMPSLYHALCDMTQNVPKGDWFCPSCRPKQSVSKSVSQFVQCSVNLNDVCSKPVKSADSSLVSVSDG